MVSISYGFVCLMISIPVSEANHCKGSAIYTLTFKAEWTKESHPIDFPPNTHFSRLVGCSHSLSYVMWRPGVNATVGVQNVAEGGRYDAINNEMDEQIRLKNALARFLGPGINGGTGTATQTGVNVNSQYPLVSFITMIAPSPDWFVGVRDYSLCNETSGKWVEKRVRDMSPYDAGTDSGLRFTSPNEPTTPHVTIFLITNKEEGSFKSDKPIKRFGTFTFEKTFESKPSTTTNIITPERTTTQRATAAMTSSVTLLEKPSVAAKPESSDDGSSKTVLYVVISISVVINAVLVVVVICVCLCRRKVQPSVKDSVTVNVQNRIFSDGIYDDVQNPDADSNLANINFSAYEALDLSKKDQDQNTYQSLVKPTV